VIAGRLNGMFDFDDHAKASTLILDPTTGQVVASDRDED
jgi:hypothetical protein